MNTGTLTPRSNDEVEAYRFAGPFGQPNGFSSILYVSIKKSGDVGLTLTWRLAPDEHEMMWSVMLDNEQRNALAQILGRYQPRTWERIGEKP